MSFKNKCNMLNYWSCNDVQTLYNVIIPPDAYHNYLQSMIQNRIVIPISVDMQGLAATLRRAPPIQLYRYAGGLLKEALSYDTCQV